jgi:hypothetical protein
MLSYCSENMQVGGNGVILNEAGPISWWTICRIQDTKEAEPSYYLCRRQDMQV